MKLLAVFCTLTILTTTALDAFAGTGLRVVPVRVHLDAAERTVPIAITNETDERRAYRISVETRYMKEEGGTYEVSSTMPFAMDPLVRISPRRTILAPGEKQTVRLQVKRGVKVEDGDYFGHIKFTEIKVPKSREQIEREAQENNGAGMSFKIGQALNLAIPATVSFGATKSDVKIETVAHSAYASGDTKFLDVTFKRAGTAQGKGYIYGRFKSNGADISDEELPVIIHRAPINIYRNINTYKAKLPISNNDVLLENGTLILTLHEGEGMNSPVVDTYKWELP